MCNFRKDKLADGSSSATQAAAAGGDEDVEMTDESEANSAHGSTTNLAAPGTKVDGAALAQAAITITQAALDVAKTGTQGAEAVVLAETAKALTEAAVEAPPSTPAEEDGSEATMLAKAASAASLQSALLHEAAEALDKKARDVWTGPSIVPSHTLQKNPAPDAYLVGSSANDIILNRSPRPAVSTQSLNRSSSPAIDKGVASSLMQLLSVQNPGAQMGPTSGGGFITMDDLKNCIFHQGMALRFRRRGYGVLPRMPKVKRQ